VSFRGEGPVRNLCAAARISRTVVQGRHPQRRPSQGSRFADRRKVPGSPRGNRTVAASRPGSKTGGPGSCNAPQSASKCDPSARTRNASRKGAKPAKETSETKLSDLAFFASLREKCLFATRASLRTSKTAVSYRAHPPNWGDGPAACRERGLPVRRAPPRAIKCTDRAVQSARLEGGRPGAPKTAGAVSDFNTTQPPAAASCRETKAQASLRTSKTAVRYPLHFSTRGSWSNMHGRGEGRRRPWRSSLTI